MDWWILAAVTIPLGWLVGRTTLVAVRTLRATRAVASSAAGAADCVDDLLLPEAPPAPRERELSRLIPDGRGGPALLPQTFRPRS